MYTEEKFLDFLIKAKKATYASQGDNASVTPLFRRFTSIGVPRRSVFIS
jgi:hypothetical protein